MRLFRHTAGYPCIGAILVLALMCVGPAQAGESKPTGHYVDVGSRQAPLHLWVEGQGEPILMIHGLGATTYTWRHLIPDLARTHRIIAVDLKGAGKSDKPLDEAYGILDQAAVLKILVDRKGLTNLTLVGHSLGGGVALALALDLNRTSPGTHHGNFRALPRPALLHDQSGFVRRLAHLTVSQMLPKSPCRLTPLAKRAAPAAPSISTTPILFPHSRSSAPQTERPCWR
jgi:alpha/beta hydrolase fold